MLSSLAAAWQKQTSTTRQILSLLAIAGAWAVSPAFGVLLLLVPQVRQFLLQTVRQGLDAPLSILWLPMLLPIMAFAYTHPVPPDDLLKHLVSGVYHFHYRTMFWGSPSLMAGDLYWGFDHVAALVYATLPPRLAYLPFQIVLTAGFAIALPLVARRQLPDLPPYLAAAIAVTLATLVWLLPGFVGRMVSGRPEDDLALWATLVFLLRADRPSRTWVWYAFGLLSVPMYWLSCVYFPVVFLMPVRFRHRVAAFLGLCFSFVAFWGIYSRGHWFLWLLSLHADIANRVLGVAEDLSAIPLIQSFAGLTLLLLGLWILFFPPTPFGQRRVSFTAFPGLRKISVALAPEGTLLPSLLFAWFLIPDMIRYADSLGPIAIVLLARQINRYPQLRSLSISYRPIATISAFLVSTLVIGYTFHPHPMPNVHIPGYHKGEKVLTYFSSATYDALYENPGIMVAPAMELGMTKRSIQWASLDLGQGKFHCQEYRKWHVHWLVTPKTIWNASQPSCVQLYRANPRGMSLWRVR